MTNFQKFIRDTGFEEEFLHQFDFNSKKREKRGKNGLSGHFPLKYRVK